MFSSSNKKLCPLLKKECIRHQCEWFTHVRGVNPNTGQDIEEWQCVVNLVPILLIENSQQQRSTAAAVESFRNESVKQNISIGNLLAAAVEQSRYIEPATVNIIEGQSDS